ncbi:MAG: radical SAM protein [Treponema sp.]|jgi:threonylcarbamoyladenosine tRNA methylthiotransferase MtaB|nr:radical SAM protein [Treponema sp.]
MVSFSVSVYTLGCKLNQLESEAFADAFRREGFPVIPWGEAADILVINTCTVTSKADQKARRVIRKALRDNPASCLIVTGCYAQLDADYIETLEAPPAGESAAPFRRFPGGGRRLFVVKGQDKSAVLDLPRYLKHTAGDLGLLVGTWFRSGDDGGETCSEAGPFRYAPEDFSFHSRGFLKIQDGCDNHCSFCRVSLARGPSVSLEGEKVLAALQALEAGGYGEAVLTGVNISQYRDGGRDLGGLLDYLLEGTGRIALRLSSLEPEGITRKTAEVFAHPRIRPHFHLSIQSGSAGILRTMGRVYGPEDVERGIQLLRSVKEDPFLACDMITGFPGETGAEFEKTAALCERAGFAWIHAFPYSRRPGTAAWNFGNPVPEREAVRRVGVLTDMARRGRREYTDRWLGRETGVIILGNHKKNTRRVQGLSDNYLRLLVRLPPGGTPPPAGAVLRCRIGELSEGERGAGEDECDAAATPVGSWAP